MCQGQGFKRTLSVEKIIQAASANPTQQYQFNQNTTFLNKRIVGAFIMLQTSDGRYSTGGVELVANITTAKGYLHLVDGSGLTLARIPLQQLATANNNCCGYVPFDRDLADLNCLDMNKSSFQFPSTINTLDGAAAGKSVEVHFVYEQL